MRLLPVDKYTLVLADKTVSDVERVINENCDTKFNLACASFTERRLVGYCRNKKFKFSKNTNLMNSFLPVVDGYLVQIGEDSCVNIRVRMYFVTFGFCILWLLSCLLFIVVALHSRKLSLIGGTILFAMISCLSINHAFWEGVEAVKKTIADILK